MDQLQGMLLYVCFVKFPFHILHSSMMKLMGDSELDLINTTVEEGKNG